ncbi:pantoate--beta-alanine ligase [Paenibacillus sp. PAMC21692]|uniref:pantoate--beta-alanine ligase n=1 Tax=Paenibacillus sp. PAMC21692 TaxID=2762320 RepID=UPI00164E39D6|nr:pantoate--beta-alanine ligase [Paenibacillus sp. PAMC21692]QNK55330.1 pantoate--beta-alanine ligase [Paenibacillus sp. PAMC21692]
MIVCRTIQELKSALGERASDGKSLGFVPTMGYLHEGHASLLRKAREENDVAALSIFVNPLQFGPKEDLDRYPRDEERDLAIAAECGVDVVFLPTVQEMYPGRPLTKVIVDEVTDRMCGASRPGHFDGVGTVVSKLFHLLKPSRAYFGMKDAQQVAVIEQMVHDLNFDIEIVRCETVREPDGLALSSRNVYLSAEHRSQAVRLSQALNLAKEWLKEPGMTASGLKQRVESHIREADQAIIDYVELLAYPGLSLIDEEAQLSSNNGTVILALAVKFGTTRLIDNRLFETSKIGGGE